MSKKLFKTKATLFIFIIVLISFFFIFDLHQYLSPVSLKSSLLALQRYHLNHPLLSISVILLVIFPIVANKLFFVIRRYRAMSIYKKPQKFDYNLVVIGAGAAGLVASYIAATVKAKVALIEKKRMGGDCLNTGCVPSKALIKSASVISKVKRASEFGFQKGEIKFDFAEVMERVQTIIQKVAPHDSVERYTDLGVECINGKAVIKSPYEVEIEQKIDSNGSQHETTIITKRFTTRSIIIATGAHPSIPDIPGLENICFFTSDTIWNLRALPKTLLVIGGGPIGCELAQTFSRFGSKVTLVQRGKYLMKREDIDISEIIKEKFKREGINVLTEYLPQKIIIKNQSGENHFQNITQTDITNNKTEILPDKKSLYELVCQHAKNGNEQIVQFDTLLLALGRTPNVKGLGLEALGIEISGNGTIKTGDFLQTSIPNIFCAGDVAGPYKFTHTAAHQSWYASVNALFGGIKRFKVNYSAVPWATFTDPEVARVGLNEAEAKERGVKYEVTRYNLDDLDRAITDSETEGFVKVLTVSGKDKILGVTVVGNHASEIISEFVLAMKHGLGLNKILGTIHIYPTMAEANKYAAGQWKKAHTPQKLLSLISKFHIWMRN